MKKLILSTLALVVGTLLVSSLAIAYTPGAGLTLTPHDLPSTGAFYDITAADKAAESAIYGAPMNRICIFCHTPHHAMTTTEAAGRTDYFPLWNHDISNITYTPYTNTISAAPVIPDNISHQLNALLGQPGTISKLCLSCHDGSMAVAMYGHWDGNVQGGEEKGNGTNTVLGTRYAIGAGGNLQNHHPIGFDYDVVQFLDDEIAAPANLFIGTTRGMTINDALWGRRMECTSCHDVHNTKNDGHKFTWVEDRGSNLCKSCHLK